MLRAACTVCVCVCARAHCVRSEHPELSEALCEEMLTRQLECGDAGLTQPLLRSLTPWMDNLVISPHWKGNW